METSTIPVYGPAPMDIGQFEERKLSHIRHALDSRHQAVGLNGLDLIHLEHEALPDLDLDEISLESICLGQPAQTPFYVAGMTAGHPDAASINLLLARACSQRGWAMGVGSQRRELETAGSGLDQWQKLRDELPELVLFANLGISQIAGTAFKASGSRLDKIQSLVEAMNAQALVIHANALQECLQPEGTPRFRGAFEALRNVCAESKVPVVLKETGCGFSRRTLERLKDVGLAAIDVSGLGGTHWGRIEGARAEETGFDLHAAAARTFAGWGEPTAEVVANAARILNVEIWASGGVRSGLDAAKLIALGADRVGYAQPALQAALSGAESLDRWMQLQEFELRVALFCTGSRSPAELSNTKCSRVVNTKCSNGGNECRTES